MSINKYYMFILVIEFKFLVFIKDDLVFVFNNKGSIMFEKDVFRFFGLCDVCKGRFLIIMVLVVVLFGVFEIFEKIL